MSETGFSSLLSLDSVILVTSRMTTSYKLTPSSTSWSRTCSTLLTVKLASTPSSLRHRLGALCLILSSVLWLYSWNILSPTSSRGLSCHGGPCLGRLRETWITKGILEACSLL